MQETGVRRALCLTVSDRSARGERPDASGPSLAERLVALGFAVDRAVVPDEPAAIVAALRQAAPTHRLLVTTGGTGLTPRDVTPQSVRPLLDYEIPGLGEMMRFEGLRHTPRAALSRSLAGVMGEVLVLVLPGSPAGALESLDAVAPLIGHALEVLREAADHPAGAADGPGGP